MSGMRALVIDDSRAMRMVLTSLLEGLGSEVSEAADGQEALALLDRGEVPDVALVDWNMPVMNGLEFIKVLRANNAFDHVRLLVITSETEVGQMVTALAAGADEYLMKPFTRDALASKLEMLGVDLGPA